MKNKWMVLSFIFFITNFINGQIPNTLTLNDKLYGLSKFWSDANYNFVYMYKVDQDKWTAAYKDAIGNVQKTTNDYEYFRELQKLCSLLKMVIPKCIFQMISKIRS